VHAKPKEKLMMFSQAQPNDRNLPTQLIATLLGALGHPVATYWSNLTIFKLEPTTANISQHIATRWPNAHNTLHPTVLRYVALACRDRLAGASGKPRTTRCDSASKPHT